MAAIKGRGRRASDARGGRQCGTAKCQIEEVHVTELTGLLRIGPAWDHLAGFALTSTRRCCHDATPGATRRSSRLKIEASV